MILMLLASALASEPKANVVEFRMSAKVVEAAFDEMENRLMADPNIAYDPVFGIRYGPARCILVEPNVADCSFRKTYRNGKSVKARNKFRQIQQGSWIADLEL